MRSYAAVCLALLSVAPAIARAEAAPPVAIDVDPCVAVEPTTLQKLVAIELGTSIGADAAARERAALTQVTVRCIEAQTEIRLDDAITRKALIRSVELGPVDAAARTRLLALTIAELVVASWIELTLDPPALPPSGPAPPPEAQAQARATARDRAEITAPRARRADPGPSPWELGLALGGRMWTSEPDPLLGAEVDLVHRPHRWLGWTLAVGFERGVDRIRVPEGRLSLSGLDVLAAGLVHAEAGPLRLSAGAGGFLVVSLVEGLPDPEAAFQGHAVRLVTAGPAVVGRISLMVGERIGLVLRVLGGPVTLPAQANAADRPVVRLDDARLAVGLGLAVGL